MEQLPRQDSDLEPQYVGDEQLTYDYYIKARGDTNRNFIFSYPEARKCPHRHLLLMAVGGNTYHCPDCNWTFVIVTADAKPIHLRMVGAAYDLLHFAKEFGAYSLNEVLRQPHGQSDGSPHKGVIPDGMTLVDVLAIMDSINSTTADRGEAELKAIVETIWPNDREMKRRIKALKGSDLPEKQEQAKRLEAIMEERRVLREADKHPELGESTASLPLVRQEPGADTPAGH